MDPSKLLSLCEGLRHRGLLFLEGVPVRAMKIGDHVLGAAHMMGCQPSSIAF